MTDHQLPDNLVQIDVLRINHFAQKHCRCTNPTFIIDTQNHVVECGTCGAHLDPFAALETLASRHDQYNRQLQAVYQQRKELAAYKPHLVVIRDLERQYRGRKMLPCCPNCRQAFYLEEIHSWIGADFANAKRKVEVDDP